MGRNQLSLQKKILHLKIFTSTSSNALTLGTVKRAEKVISKMEINL